MIYKSIYYKFISIILILLIWWLFNKLKIINPLFLPALADTLASFYHIVFNGVLYQNLGATLFRSLSGLFLAILIGVPAGLILARALSVYRLFEFPIEFFRAIPSSALFPLFILFFGIGNASKISVVFYACSLMLLINSFYGALPNQEKMDRINMLRTLGATKYQIFFYAVVRDATPNISAGIRICLSYSIALVVVTEMILGANVGIGSLLYDYYLQYRLPEMYSVIIILGLTGFLLNRLYLVIEKKFIFWSQP